MSIRKKQRGEEKELKGNNADVNITSKTATKQQILSSVKAAKPAAKLLDNFDVWWQKANARYYRDPCFVYTDRLFDHPTTCEAALGNTLSGFFTSHGNWRKQWSFPEIHISFLCVDVFLLRDTWNRRDVDMKRALLNELRTAYVEFARHKGMDLSGLYNVVVTNIWLCGDHLVMEVPDSAFSVQYPEFCRILMPDGYKQLLLALNRETRL